MFLKIIWGLRWSYLVLKEIYICLCQRLEETARSHLNSVSENAAIWSYLWMCWSRSTFRTTLTPRMQPPVGKPGLQNPSVECSSSVVSNSLQPHESQHTRPPCPSPTPEIYSNSCPSSRWCHPVISSSVVPFSSCPQSLPASGTFPTSQLFAWGGQSIGVSASVSVLPMNTQDWSPLG